ncbi:preprotein translocase subunit SecE [Gemmata obscuriglobus]|nr:preprotein translocase subunit SecE [Gemmata obscuriglobus]QEG30708.1 preprotein translocase subunit SecE [Gemmata obscuriglobus]VTS10035.1 preprotein translocase subunit : Protein translocase subunit SecE OS=Rhodopirellula sp. SWK7 GN=secE PE=3 SV=1: SecE [Gemmata obscuriglobus UQM 2246]
MATAVETSSAPSTPGQSLSLPVASLLGAIYVVAVLAIVLYVIPLFWSQSVSPSIGSRPADYLLWFTAEVAALIGLSWVGFKIAGNPPKGTHAGIFLVISAVIAIFFVARAFAMNIEGPPGMAVAGVVALALAFGAVRFLAGVTGAKWMVMLEEQGWFTTHQYKRSLGVKVRRLTILGVLIIGVSGAWSMFTNGLVGEQLELTLPFGWRSVPLMHGFLLTIGAKVVVLALLVAVTLWVSLRAVNVPDFAEFLIATEAEMNKVSWSTRKRLAQDTVVVLVTTLLMTVFLLAVDLFWGWLLSRQTVGVLPARATNADKGAQVQEAKW